MRDIIGLILGLYLTVALVVFGGAAYGFMSGEQAKFASCAAPPANAAVDGSNWIPWALYRASLWPKTYFDDAEKASDLIDWLLVHYNPGPGICR